MKWGILATGTIANKFASTIALMKEEGQSLAAVGSRTAGKAREFAGKYDIPKFYGSYEEMLSDREVEAVYVATPNAMHERDCALCLKAGKHVLCEKPFTIHPAQARELYALAQEKGLFIMEGLWTRHLPIYARLREVLAEGAVGDVTRIFCQYGFVATGARKDRKFNSALGGGALLDIGIYNLGFLQAVTGADPVSFRTEKVDINEYGTDAYSDLRLVYPGDIQAESIQTIGTVLERNALITGTKGSIFLPDFQEAQEMVIRREGCAEETVKCPFDHNGFEYEIRVFESCVRQKKKESGAYPQRDSLALSQLLYDIRMSWQMKFEGEA